MEAIPEFDVLVAGGGPGGSAAAWTAARQGARVLLCEKAVYPRDKPCGDGLSARAVRLLDEMGLAAEFANFHPLEAIKVVGDGWQVTREWPAAQFGFLDHGYSVPRTRLDQLLAEHAAAAGAEVREGVRSLGPLVEDGAVKGLRLRHGDREEEIRAPVVIAADGMSSPTARGAGLTARARFPYGVAMRARTFSDRDDNGVAEFYVNLKHDRRAIPAYGWVFPVGCGEINVGVGVISTYSGWEQLNILDIMRGFLDDLPEEWGAPGLADLQRDEALAGWRLPMGLSVWPPYRPGIMAVGDAVGAARPFTGSGISKAIETGMMAARVAVDRLDGGGAGDLSVYGDALHTRFGAHYRLGRVFLRAIGKPPIMRTFGAGLRATRVASASIRVMSNLYRERGGDLGDRVLRTIDRVGARIRTPAQQHHDVRAEDVTVARRISALADRRRDRNQ